MPSALLIRIQLDAKIMVKRRASFGDMELSPHVLARETSRAYYHGVLLLG